MLEGRDLTCIRGERLVFAGLDFEIGPGDACLLTGRNGSGKSSLLRMIAGLLQPAAGGIRWRGRPLGDDVEAFRSELHFVGHLDAVKPVLTVRENLEFWRAMRGGTGIDAGVQAFGLSELRDLPARVLSAGQKRRVALARLLVAPATLWLLDEPTVALDGAGIAAVEKAVATHRAGGGMVVLSSHVPIALADPFRLELTGAFLSAPAPC